MEHERQQKLKPPVDNAAPTVTEISKLSLQPGDVLALRIDRPLLVEQREKLKQWFSEQLPPGTHTLIMEPFMSLEAVKRKTEEGASQ
jgi:hypothetical protein